MRRQGGVQRAGQAGKPGDLWRWAEVMLPPGAGLTSQPRQDWMPPSRSAPKPPVDRMGGHPEFLAQSLPWMAVGYRGGWGNL